MERRDIRIKIYEGSPEAEVLDRVRAALGYTGADDTAGPRWTDVVRTITLRYGQLLASSKQPTGDVVRAFSEGLVHNGGVSCLFQVRYPERQDTIAAIESAPNLSDRKRRFILDHLSTIPSCEYACLIEAAEHYIGANGGSQRR